MRKCEADVLQDIHSQLEDTIDPKQFRRGLESIHDIIHNDIYVADHIMNKRHHGDLEATYMNIIKHSIYAICMVQNDYKPQPEPSPMPVDALLQETEEMIETVTTEPSTPTIMHFGEKVPQENEYSSTVDQLSTQLDQLTKPVPMPIVSKNNRRK